MRINTCIYCGEIIPEGGLVCCNCEHKIMKTGAILQSMNATDAEIQGAYDILEKELQNKMIRRFNK